MRTEFITTDDNVYFVIRGKQKWLCQSFKTRSLNAGDEFGWSELVSFDGADGNHREVLLPWADVCLHPYKSMTKLMATGMRISTEPGARRNFIRFLDDCRGRQ